MKMKIGTFFNRLMGRIEMGLSNNWFNPLATIYLNLRSFPLRQALKMPIYVYGNPRFFSLQGKMIVDGIITKGMIKLNYSVEGAPSNASLKTEIMNDGIIIFKGKGLIGTGNRIRVYINSTLELGDSFKISDMVNLGCYEKIEIGSCSRIAHRCQIFDTNYHYLLNINKRCIPNMKKSISIGNFCWIGNTTTITSGVIIPDYTIIASNSLVNKRFNDIPMFSLLGGIPAKLIGTGFRRVENQDMVSTINKWYKNSNDYYILPENEDLEKYVITDKYL